MYCEKCGEDKPSEGCQELKGQIVCEDCFDGYLSYRESLADAEKERE